MQKVMETVVHYAEALHAERLVDIEGPGHFVIPEALPGISPPVELLEELVDASLKTKFPFTLDPRPPLDFQNLFLRPQEQVEIETNFLSQSRYDELMLQLGLRDQDAYTCNPYQLETGNIPERDTILAWSKSACVVYANSVLGARTNRNGAIVDILSNIAGKTPFSGLITDEGRKATWLIDIKTKNIPNPKLLGAVIGKKVLEDVPYLINLDRFLSPKLNSETTDFLQEMGTACAAFGAVGLFHVENITPEAVDYGRDLLVKNHQTYIIDDKELQSLYNSFHTNYWPEKNAQPEICLIGCPHLSLNQLYEWASLIEDGLKKHSKDCVNINTILFASPDVLKKFKADKVYNQLLEAGIKFSSTCSESIFGSCSISSRPILTNSIKLKAYTSAWFYPDEILAKIIVTGKVE